jgi:adenine-specific DNA-methyltransferase
MNDPFLSDIDNIRTEALKQINKERQNELGQFLTPLPIAKFMASMFSVSGGKINLLDPGAGTGTLTAAFLAQIIGSDAKLPCISTVAYEMDPYMGQFLTRTMEACQLYCEQLNTKFDYKILQEDFISASVASIIGVNSLFPTENQKFNYAILNPPYQKINSNSHTRRLLKSVGLETTNLYTAFLWLVVKQLDPGGELVAIVPRSFCNGTYFRPFRSDFLNSMTIRRIHIFESRTKAFKEGDVLQENIIISAVKEKGIRGQVAISSSYDPLDEGMTLQNVDYAQVVNPDDPDMFIHIVTDQLGHQINNRMKGLSATLDELGLSVSTGRVVDFRARDYLQYYPSRGSIPLIYSGNFVKGFVTWPKQIGKKATSLTLNPKIDDLLVPASVYVLVKRFTSKEEKKRVSAAIYDPERIHADRVGFENHINYFYRRYGKLSLTLAKGLSVFLNSTLVDQYFRQFSGHTQVNVTDLKKLKYPTETVLYSIGTKIGQELPDQDEIDRIVTEELTLDDTERNALIPNPIQAKKRIREALSILQMFNLPRSQQNDRSALTLLALLNLRGDVPWSASSSPLIGITEMMDFFRECYGINYAPNTRETVRRETVHQFLQIGMIVANPDNPSRPINSPKTRYQIEPSALSLLRLFGTPDWESHLKEYLNNAPKLANLQFRERQMNLIPVILPDGVKLLLSAGGQNELIRKVIEEFCPRFTPGGRVIYVGDAGEKLTDRELQYFGQLGIQVEPHGKMPDVIIYMPEKNWLVLVEAVTSHGPINNKRFNELKLLFSGTIGLVFVTAFENRSAMNRYLREIAWETDVWVAETPSHLIHFNGERFLGPY